MNGDLTAEVLSSDPLSERLVRLVLGGPGLATFASSGVPDEWVRITLPGQDQARYYTVRRWDPDRTELVVDVVVHDHGLVTEWARRGCVGDRLLVSAPRGSFRLPPRPQWLLLVGDLTSLPAIARIVEGLPPGLPARAFVEVPPGEAPDYFGPDAGVEVTWLEHRASGSSPSRLERVVRELPWPQGEGYFWMAGEAGQMRGIRKYLRHDLGLPQAAYDVMGYWRFDAERWQAAYDAARIDAARIWAEGERAGKEAAEIWDEYEAALGRAGL